MTAYPVWMFVVALLLLSGPAPVVARLTARSGAIASIPRPVRPTTDPLAASAALDLLAACLRGGLPMATAAVVAAAAAPAELSAALRRGADLLTLGADPEFAWQGPSGADDATRGLARMARRSARSGASLAGGIAELAEQNRHTATDRAQARAERAGVLIAGPLGLCFLPAFICLGIVPVVIGLAEHVLGGVQL